MKNLRCHSILEMELGQATNFIIGENGSGKSTVALAVQLALNMPIPDDKQGVVRSDAASSEALAIIELCNVGPEGSTFMPHLYGDVITIQRKVKRSEGAGAATKLTATLMLQGSKFLNGKHHTLTGVEAKADLEKLCAVFSITPENVRRRVMRFIVADSLPLSTLTPGPPTRTQPLAPAARHDHGSRDFEAFPHGRPQDAVRVLHEGDEPQAPL